MSAEPFYAIRRTDGELLMGEYAWMAADGPDDWTVPDNSDHDEPTEYEIVNMRPERVAVRTFGEPEPEEDGE